MAATVSMDVVPERPDTKASFAATLWGNISGTSLASIGCAYHATMDITAVLAAAGGSGKRKFGVMWNI